MSLFKDKLELKVEEAEFKAGQALSGFSAWQKWVIFICLFGAIPAYFIAKAIGNVYFEKQYKQYLIEAHPSFSNPQSLLIDRIDIASLGEGEYTVVAQVINPNLDLAAKAIPYELKFYGKDGTIVAPSQTGEFYILPNQRKYVVAPRIESQSGLAKATLGMPSDITWQKKLELPKVLLQTSLPKGQDQLDPFGYALEGTVTNQSPYYIKEIKLTFLLYGMGGKIIGSSQRSEFSLKPFETRGYKQLWVGISGRNVLKAESYAETNLLDKDNLSAPEFPTDNGAGGLGR